MAALVSAVADEVVRKVWHDHTAIARLVVAVRPLHGDVRDHHEADPASGVCMIRWHLDGRLLARATVSPDGRAEAWLFTQEGEEQRVLPTASYDRGSWSSQFTFALHQHLTRAAGAASRAVEEPDHDPNHGHVVPSATGPASSGITGQEHPPPPAARSVLLFTATAFGAVPRARQCLEGHCRMLDRLTTDGWVLWRCAVEDDGLLRDIVVTVVPVEQARDLVRNDPALQAGVLNVTAHALLA